MSSRVKFGIDVSLESYEAETWDRYTNFVKTVDDGVWDSIWLGDHLGGLPPFISSRNYNIWLLFSIFAEMKKRALFGTAVTDPHRYHPAILAQMAVTVDHISSGRFIFGIGAGEAFNLKSYGFEYNKPVSKMVEFIEVLKQLWTSKGEKTSYEGKFFKLKDAVLQPSPIQKPHIPIWMAANSPRTRELTGAIADGWLPLSYNPEMYKIEAREVKRSLRKNNRSLEEFTLGYWNYIFLHEDEAELKGYLDSKKLTIPILYAKTLKPLGYWKEEKLELYNKLGFKPDTLSLLSFSSLDELDLFAADEIVSDIPDEDVRKATLMGNKEELTQKLEALIKAGAQHIVLMIDNDIASNPRKPDPFTYEHVFKVLQEEIIPYLKERY